jgi:hypothetical protein
MRIDNSADFLDDNFILVLVLIIVILVLARIAVRLLLVILGKQLAEQLVWARLGWGWGRSRGLVVILRGEHYVGDCPACPLGARLDVPHPARGRHATQGYE